MPIQKYCTNCKSELLIGKKERTICLECHEIQKLPPKRKPIILTISIIIILTTPTLLLPKLLFLDIKEGIIIIPKNIQKEIDFEKDYLPPQLMKYSYDIIIVNETITFRKNNSVYGFHTFTDKIYLLPERSEATLLHEMGHRIWLKELTYEEKLIWKNISEQDNKSISDYADIDIYEDFAETFMCSWIPENAIFQTTKNKKQIISLGCKNLLNKERLAFIEKINDKITR